MQVVWLIEPVCFVVQGGDFECNEFSDGKTMNMMKIVKEINGVPLTYGYVADDQSFVIFTRNTTHCILT